MAGLSTQGEDIVDATVQMLRTLPHLAIVPLFILWFGIGETPKIALPARRRQDRGSGPDTGRDTARDDPPHHPARRAAVGPGRPAPGGGHGLAEPGRGRADQRHQRYWVFDHGCP
ncbi:hypothetical protein G6F31_018783 [Rhizopus arrhizus]|nr:hypothetical protein G6F31_018783 [Rhizopus arrhizus]